MLDGYLIAWGVWLLGSLVCLAVWAKMLNGLPEIVFYIIWWSTLGVLLAPATQEAGSPLWVPALVTAAFDMLNDVEGGFMRAGWSVILGAGIGAALGTVMSVVRTRKRLKNVMN